MAQEHAGRIQCDDCGCSVDIGRLLFIFCPLHEAALRMLAILRRATVYLDSSIHDDAVALVRELDE